MIVNIKETDSVKAAVRWKVNVLSYGHMGVRFTNAACSIRLISAAFAMSFHVSG